MHSQTVLTGAHVTGKADFHELQLSCPMHTKASAVRGCRCSLDQFQVLQDVRHPPQLCDTRQISLFAQPLREAICCPTTYMRSAKDCLSTKRALLEKAGQHPSWRWIGGIHPSTVNVELQPKSFASRVRASLQHCKSFCYHQSQQSNAIAC